MKNKKAIVLLHNKTKAMFRYTTRHTIICVPDYGGKPSQTTCFRSPALLLSDFRLNLLTATLAPSMARSLFSVQITVLINAFKIL